jgi:hypothetical protein
LSATVEVCRRKGMIPKQFLTGTFVALFIHVYGCLSVHIVLAHHVKVKYHLSDMSTIQPMHLVYCSPVTTKANKGYEGRLVASTTMLVEVTQDVYGRLTR